MSQTVNPKKRTFWFRPSAEPRPGTREITSLDDIPEFDNAEDEAHFWRSHTVSKEVLDQIPHVLEEEE